MNSIVFVNFECNESTKVVAQKIWQYDYGQILRIQGLNLPAAVEIHFSLQKTGGAAKRRIGVTRDGVTDVVIPDFILTGEGIERDYTAYAFIYLSTEEYGQTEHRIELNIKSRPEPEGSSGSDETSFGAIMDAIKTFAAGKADGLKYENSILKLMSGETELARVTIKAGEGTGPDAREIELQKSDTAIQWRYVGDEEWTDLVLLEELKGEKGDPGEGGKTAYQYAQDGGYTGTEEEFAKKLAQENPTREEFSQLQDTMEELTKELENIKNGGEQGGSASVTGLKSILTDMVTFLKSVPFDDDSASASDLDAIQNKVNMLGGSDDEPTNPIITLVSISVIPNVTEYADGTLAKDLDLTVKAHYLDGNIVTIENYVINGIVVVGENTFTVSYGGKSTTVTVTGITIQNEFDVEMDAKSFSYMGLNAYTDDGQTEWTGSPALSASSSATAWFSADPFEKDGIVEYTITNNTTANYRGKVFLGLVDEKPVKNSSVVTVKWTKYYNFKEYFGSPSDSYITVGGVGTVTYPVKKGMYLVRFVDNATGIIQDGLEQRFVFKEA